MTRKPKHIRNADYTVTYLNELARDVECALTSIRKSTKNHSESLRLAHAEEEYKRLGADIRTVAFARELNQAKQLLKDASKIVTIIQRLNN